jgi:polyisoprenoid-binding protein YceI
MMKKLLIVITAILVLTNLLYAQDRYFTKSGSLSFLSETLVENIFAETKEATSFLDIKTGEVVFSANINSFQFKIKLMQEHFNENYMESEKYPKATFSGKMENFGQFDPKSTKPQNFTVKGKMNIHGTEKEVTANVVMTVTGAGKINGTSSFTLKPEEYSIKVPSAMGMKIAKEVTITVKADYEVFKP